ncbi:hypothetical protein [uncultured Tenacibaculum sp.]|uniref:hypothetical protein n=1 Tax=uncultured Tenacibaculum sp. TaxID=174713 RepID=UPI00260A859B|nr:hypothetical protein [uncultured Tenacibaculum sp.]
MKKSILFLGKSLNKKTQKNINGGMFSNCPSSPTCYGVSGVPTPCGTCEQYHLLPQECKMRVKVGVSCFQQ